MDVYTLSGCKVYPLFIQAVLEAQHVGQALTPVNVVGGENQLQGELCDTLFAT